jgi:hypothetical protein
VVLTKAIVEQGTKMRINNNNYSVAELLDMLERRELVINRDYQRGSGLWPSGARSYFIDTILEEFPFPKLYMYEFMDRPAGRLRKELVDGQQRLMTIKDFVENKFALSGDTQHIGLRYRDLEEEVQDKLLSYAVSVDVVRNASRAQILQMFRRMNAYTLPLNEAEKRHSSFYGEFKWFINNLSDEVSEFLTEYQVFTSRQIVRMADAEFLTDLVLALERGIVSTSPSDLRGLYRAHDDAFPNAERVGGMIKDTVHFIIGNFHNLRGSHMMKPYAAHSLITAMLHARFGIPAVDHQVRGDFGNRFCVDPEEAAARLRELAEAHEAKEIDGPHARYVWGCLGGTNRAGRRLARILAIFHALGFADVEVISDDLAGLLPY